MAKSPSSQVHFGYVYVTGRKILVSWEGIIVEGDSEAKGGDQDDKEAITYILLEFFCCFFSASFCLLVGFNLGTVDG